MSKINPCVLLLSDIHVSKDNIPEFTANWQEALAICEGMNIQEIAFGGDMFMSRSAQTLDVLLAVHDALLAAEKRGIHVTLANGNHDFIQQEAIRGYCHVFDQHANVLVVDEMARLLASEDWEFVLHIIPYFPENGSFIEKLDKLTATGLDKKRKNYLYIHEGINGALSQPNEKELSPNIFRIFDKVFVGHYHNRCIIDGTNVEYIGSSRQMNFGEDEEKGYTVIYPDGRYDFIKNRANTRYLVMDVQVEKTGIHLSDKLEEIKEDGRYRVKVRVHTSSAKASGIDKEKLLQAGASKVEIVTEDSEITEVAGSGLFEKFDNHQIKETYEAFCDEKKIEDVELGLSYLSKIE